MLEVLETATRMKKRIASVYPKVEIFKAAYLGLFEVIYGIDNALYRHAEKEKKKIW